MTMLSIPTTWRHNALTIDMVEISTPPHCTPCKEIFFHPMYTGITYASSQYGAIRNRLSHLGFENHTFHKTESHNRHNRLLLYPRMLQLYTN